jgi:hypothetical protein
VPNRGKHHEIVVPTCCHDHGTLGSSAFLRHRIEAVVERFANMQANLDRERKAVMGCGRSARNRFSDGWALRRLAGIAGRSLLEIEGLEMPLLDGPSESRLPNEGLNGCWYVSSPAEAIEDPIIQARQ